MDSLRERGNFQLNYYKIYLKVGPHIIHLALIPMPNMNPFLRCGRSLPVSRSHSVHKEITVNGGPTMRMAGMRYDESYPPRGIFGTIVGPLAGIEELEIARFYQIVFTLLMIFVAMYGIRRELR